ncbi:MAG: helix-turn-helix transcriptional regulator, partial [Lachnospiraceae bacterium]|nr:helix-turn-helix transcriptional regulator [Lachnospiraceae bacterium]
SVFKEPLTEKEQAVARLAALGYKNEEIAGQLYISSNTVKYHLANIYKKLNIKNRVELKNAMEMAKKSEYAYWTELHKHSMKPMNG